MELPDAMDVHARSDDGHSAGERRSTLLHRDPQHRGRMIVSMHVATGAAGGALAGSRLRAALLGLVLHGICDRIPHRDIASRRFETRSGLALLSLLAAVRGPFDPAVVGAAASSAPDLEHVLRLPRPGGRKLYPTHRFPGWHRGGGVSTCVQLFTAGAIVGLLLRRPAVR